MDNKALYKLSYGLFVLTATDGQKDNGCIVNTAIQAASSPNTMSICLNKANYTHDMIVKTKSFNVSVLSVNVPYITRGTNACFSVRVDKCIDLGSHSMFIGEITDMKVLSDAPSATYEYYQNNIKPKAQAVAKTPDGQTVWRCKICGYEYVGEELPDDFICPVCKHPASDFEKVTVPLKK